MLFCRNGKQIHLMQAIEDLPLEEEHVSDDSCSSKCASNHPDLLSDQNNFPIDEVFYFLCCV